MSGSSTAELLEWIALRRVTGGRLIQLAGGRYLHNGKALPDYVTGTLPRLLAEGLVALEPLDPDYRHRRVRLTQCGQARNEALCDTRDSDNAHLG